MSESVTILERFARLPAGAIDRERGIIRGVKVLGLESKNGRTYSKECIAAARSLYEGSKVNLNHPAKPGDPRLYQDRLGLLKNTTLKEDGLYADFHYNPKHAVAEQFLHDAENAPESLGFSHNAVVKFGPAKQGKKVVESIVAVNSVDLVADPATTNGLFEDITPVEDPDIPLSGRSKPLNDLGDDAFAYIEPGGKRDPSGKTTPRAKRLWPLDSADSIRAAFNSIRKSSLPGEEKSRALANTLRAAKRFKINLPAPAGAKEHQEGDMSLAELTLEEIKASRPDLLDAIRAEGDTAKALEAKEAEAKALREKVAAMEAEQAKLKRQASIDAALTEAKLDKANEQHCSKTFLAQLSEAKDDATIKALIEDRAALVAVATEQRKGALSTKPVSTGAGTAAGTPTYEQIDAKQWGGSLLTR